MTNNLSVKTTAVARPAGEREICHSPGQHRETAEGYTLELEMPG